MTLSCVIPARIGSSRFPGKPLAKIDGLEMILHTLNRALLAGCFDSILCATDSQEIASLVRQNGFDAVMTGTQATGSDRVMEAAQKLNLDLVVNLQGDEPLVDLDLLRRVSKALKAEPKSWVTASSPLKRADVLNRDVVKVRVNENYAVAFQREIDLEEYAEWNEHRGIYAYSREGREEFYGLAQSENEKKYSLEPLRILGIRPIKVIFSESESASVDVPSDILKIEQMIKKLETRVGN